MQSATAAPQARPEFTDEVNFDGKKIRIYPVGFNQIEAFTEAIARAVPIIAAAHGLGDAKSLIRLIMPAMGRDLIRLAGDCCVPTLDEVNPPHWIVATILEKWIALSFLGDPEKKIRPWVDAAQHLINEATGTELDLWRTLSSSSSAPDSPGVTSPGAGATAGPMTAGHGPSSSDTPVPPIEP